MRKCAHYRWKSRYFLRMLCFCTTVFFLNSSHAQPQLHFQPIIQNLSKPLEIKNAGDSSNRLFIVEQGGLIKIYKKGTLLKKPFLDLSNVIIKDSFKGLWSIAFPPDYKSNPNFFVFYVDTNNETVLARYRTSSTNHDSALPNSGVTLLSFKPIQKNGSLLGELQFGKDGYLYITITDGSFNSQITELAQDGHSLLGKMLRLDINVNHPPYYRIPRNNPYVNDSAVLDEIWDFGFHNAWRWSFDKSTGDTWIGDPGGDKWDEVDFRKSNRTAAVNYGWPCYEADQLFLTSGCLPKKNYVFPVFSYPHDNRIGNAVIGGYVYRGSLYPDLYGYYVCSDFYSLKSWKIVPNNSGGWNVYEQDGIPGQISGYGEDENGELYAASLLGTVYKIATTPTTQSQPIISFVPHEKK